MRASLTVVAAIAMLSGCGAPPEPGPVPTAASSSTAVSPTTRGPVPKVARALDLTGHLANPCDLLGKEDLDALHFEGDYVVIPPYPDQEEPACEIGGGSRGSLLYLTLYPGHSPLSEAYASPPGEYEYFQTRPILGFPAVALARSVIAPGTCVVSVATSDQQGFTLHHGPGTEGSAAEACARVTTAAEGVLKRLGA
jgi:hypothetical protein